MLVTHLLDMTLEAEPTQKPPGEEFGVACFDELDRAKLHEIFVERIKNKDRTP